MKHKLQLAVFLFFGSLVSAQNLPTGFSLITITDELESISTFTFLDENTILIAKQNGYIYVIENDVLVPEPIVRIPTLGAGTGDRGLVGMKIDLYFLYC